MRAVAERGTLCSATNSHQRCPFSRSPEGTLGRRDAEEEGRGRGGGLGKREKWLQQPTDLLKETFWLFSNIHPGRSAQTPVFTYLRMRNTDLDKYRQIPLFGHNSKTNTGHIGKGWNVSYWTAPIKTGRVALFL